VSFIPNQPHCEDVAQRGGDEVRIFANQQFQPLRKKLDRRSWVNETGN
jgi:hypothetical protein